MGSKTRKRSIFNDELLPADASVVGNSNRAINSSSSSAIIVGLDNNLSNVLVSQLHVADVRDPIYRDRFLWNDEFEGK